MKLMNEIECDVAGELVKKLVANGHPSSTTGFVCRRPNK